MAGDPGKQIDGDALMRRLFYILVAGVVAYVGVVIAFILL